VNGIEKHCVSRREQSRKPELSGVNGSRRRSTGVNPG
jgi:hypothetical protein